jgi:hypothetical protein
LLLANMKLKLSNAGKKPIKWKSRERPFWNLLNLIKERLNIHERFVIRPMNVWILWKIDV